MIEVVVGKEAALWFLHEKLLSAGSTFFKAAIHNPFKERNERKITLVTDENLVFQLFVQHLYTRTFQTNSMGLLLQAYVLGDRLGAPDFQAQALDQIYALNHHSCEFNAKQVLWVFNNTLPHCGLRRFTADTVAHATLRQELNYGKEDWEMLAPVMPELMEGVISIAGVQDPKNWWSRKPRLAYVEKVAGKSIAWMAKANRQG
jgi:BTB/POZ domain